MRPWSKTTVLLGFLISFPQSASALSQLPLDPSLFPDPNSLIPSNIANALIKSVGLISAHRPHEPATPILFSPGGVPRAGVDMSLVITLAHIPDDFKSALTLAGLSNNNLPTQVLPVPRFQVHKGLSQSLDVGGSFIGYRGYTILGADLKIALNSPEAEGPTYAIRFCYTNTSMGIVKTKTYSPQILMSRSMFFADPYIGIAYEWTKGRLEIPIPNPITGGTLLTLTKDGSGSGVVAFMGVGFRTIPFKLTVEGAYSTAGIHTLGTKFGFNF